MTCRHAPGDINCSSHPANVRREARLEHDKELAKLRAQLPTTPDSANYHVTEVARVGANLVMKVTYPNCAKCAYEGQKVLVFLNVTESDALRWKTIDPHFRDLVDMPKDFTRAPPPAARFPASTAGWSDALAYASGKVAPNTRSPSR